MSLQSKMPSISNNETRTGSRSRRNGGTGKRTCSRCNRILWHHSCRGLKLLCSISTTMLNTNQVVYLSVCMLVFLPAGSRFCLHLTAVSFSVCLCPSLPVCLLLFFPLLLITTKRRRFSSPPSPRNDEIKSALFFFLYGLLILKFSRVDAPVDLPQIRRPQGFDICSTVWERNMISSVLWTAGFQELFLPSKPSFASPPLPKGKCFSVMKTWIEKCINLCHAACWKMEERNFIFSNAKGVNRKPAFKYRHLEDGFPVLSSVFWYSSITNFGYFFWFFAPCLEFQRYDLIPLYYLLSCSYAESYYSFPRSGELRTQKLKSHLVRIQSLNVLPLEPGVVQYIAIHATPTARDFFLAYFYSSSLFTCIFSKTSPDFSCVGCG